MRVLNGYAGPSIWGPEVEVAAHVGAATFSIEYEATGDTLVFGRVRYFGGDGGGTEKVEEFKDSISIQTANAVAAVHCRFRGVPLGSTVTITVEP